MGTFIFELASSIDDRLLEVDLLIDKARQETDKSNFFNVLCRSAIILTVAHLEGFIKDCAKALIDDLNTFSKFRQLPKPIKRTFCKLYIGASDKEYSKALEERTSLLIDTFDTLDTKLVLKPFLFEDNKNPSPMILNRICNNFGVRNFFNMLSESALDIVFEDSPKTAEELLAKLKGYILNHVQTYPYTINLAEFNIGYPTTGQNGQRSLWEAFLDQLLEARHSIAHGTSLINGCSLEEVIGYKDKTQIIQLAFMLVLCHSVLAAPPAIINNTP